MPFSIEELLQLIQQEKEKIVSRWQIFIFWESNAVFPLSKAPGRCETTSTFAAGSSLRCLCPCCGRNTTPKKGFTTSLCGALPKL